MELKLLDRITLLEKGERIRAVKSLTLTEEYLADHFPRFPVMPGVLMLECLFQASAWLLRVSDDFKRPLVQLVETRNVKFADFVQPGQTLTVEASVLKTDGDVVTLKAQGTLGDRPAVSGRLILSYGLVKDVDGPFGVTDEIVRFKLKQELGLLVDREMATALATR